jgi:competence protein ComGC
MHANLLLDKAQSFNSMLLVLLATSVLLLLLLPAGAGVQKDS